MVGIIIRLAALLYHITVVFRLWKFLIRICGAASESSEICWQYLKTIPFLVVTEKRIYQDNFEIM